jgi:hypothetical protein
MSTAAERLLNRDRTPTCLTALDAPGPDGPPPRPGIYAAWITTRQALDDLGVAGRLPLLMYVGKAARGGGGALDRRVMKRHVGVAFDAVNEMLAVRGHALFPWDTRMQPPADAGRMYQYTPLGEIASRTTVEWQFEHLCWNWECCTEQAAPVQEKKAIIAGEPLLNVAGTTDGVPLLRRRAQKSRAAARWLWHTSWAALYTVSRDRRFEKRYWGDVRRGWGADQQGWPIPRSVADDERLRLPIPDNEELEAIVLEAAREASPLVRHALGEARSDEWRMWWAAHAGAAFLAKPVAIAQAMSSSLRQESEEIAPCPDTLPQRDHLAKLVKLVRCLPRTYH